MRFDSATDRRRGHWVDARTKQPVRWVRWYDDETGEYEAFRFDPKLAERSGVDLRSILYRGRAQLEFVQTGVALPPAPTFGPTASPTSPRKGRRGILLPPDTVEECEVRGCHRRAEWYTHDVKETEPVKGQDGLTYKKQTVLVRHFFCHNCYRLPVRTNLRGVEDEVQVRMARPEWRSL